MSQRGLMVCELTTADKIDIMEEAEFLDAAVALAAKHPSETLAQEFSAAWNVPERDLNRCTILASKLILKMSDGSEPMI